MVETAGLSAPPGPDRIGNPELQLSLLAVRAALEPTRQAVLTFLAPWALDAPVLYKIELVLEETLLNAILHAFNGPGPHHLGLRVQVQPAQVLLHFDDEGVAFDPLRAEPPVRPASLDEARPGGLGLMLVRRLAQTVQYQRLDGHNLLSIAVARG